MHDIVTYNRKGNKLICSFAADLDSVVSEVIGDDLFDNVQKANCPTVFDFIEVGYVSSVFLRESIKIARIMPDMKITISNASPLVKEIYETAGLSKIVIFVDN